MTTIYAALRSTVLHTEPVTHFLPVLLSVAVQPSDSGAPLCGQVSSTATTLPVSSLKSVMREPRMSTPTGLSFTFSDRAAGREGTQQATHKQTLKHPVKTRGSAFWAVAVCEP